MNAVDTWLASTDDEMRECSECGHVHFNAKTRSYVRCPLADEGCTCSLNDEDADA